MTRPFLLVGHLALAAMLPACGAGVAPSASISRASLVADPAPALEADLDLVLSRDMLEALGRGIPLVLELALEGRGDAATLTESRRLRLRYLPLARRWQLLDGGGAERHFARRAQLLAALDRVRLPLPATWLALLDDGEFRLTLSLDASALPGPLRLPALLRRDWRLPTTTYAWHAAR